MGMDSKAGKGRRSRAQTRGSKRAARMRDPELRVNVTFRHLEPTEALQQYAERKLAHVARALKRPCEAHLILSVDKYRHCGEVTFKAGRLAAAAAEENTDLYAVIDLLADKVERQLKKHVEKLTAKRMRAPSTPEVLTAQEPGTV